MNEVMSFCFQKLQLKCHVTKDMMKQTAAALILSRLTTVTRRSLDFLGQRLLHCNMSRMLLLAWAWSVIDVATLAVSPQQGYTADVHSPQMVMLITRIKCHKTSHHRSVTSLSPVFCY